MIRFLGKHVLSALTIIVMAAAGLCGCGFSLPFMESEESSLTAGLTLLESREYKEAMSRFEAAYEQGERNAELFRAMGIASYHLGDYDGAEGFFKEALTAMGGIVTKSAFDVSYYLADTYTAKSMYSEAIDIYNAVLDLRPNDQDAVYLRGLMYLKRGDHNAASEDFGRVLDERPLRYDRVISIYQALSQAGYDSEGRQMLQRILGEGVGMSNYEKGRFSYYLGDYDGAKSYLEAANSEGGRSSEKIPIVILLGEVNQALGDQESAISVYRRFLQEDQSQAVIYNALGACEMRMGKYSDALSDFQIGLSLGDVDQNASLLRNMVSAYEHMGNFQTAAQRMQEYLELEPSDAEAVRENIFITTRIEEMAGEEGS